MIQVTYTPHTFWHMGSYTIINSVKFFFWLPESSHVIYDQMW